MSDNRFVLVRLVILSMASLLLVLMVSWLLSWLFMQYAGVGYAEELLLGVSLSIFLKISTYLACLVVVLCFGYVLSSGSGVETTEIRFSFGMMAINLLYVFMLGIVILIT